jgi:CRISPR-associated endonuclease/helicase Cas3
MRRPHKKTNQPVSQPLELNTCLAKTRKMPDDQVLPGRKVLEHCIIVGKVADNLLRRLPGWLVRKHFPLGSALVAATHDIGKASPTFQHKIYKNLTETPTDIWSLIESFDQDENKSWGGHAGVSQSTVDSLQVGKFVPQIIGQHHGFAPNLGGRQAVAEDFGGQTWLDLRVELVKQLKLELKQDFPDIQSHLQAKLIAGLTTVSDWVGSGSLFDDPNSEWQSKIEQALDEAGFIAPDVQSGLSFKQVFGFEPRESQLKLIETVKGPGVYILEAPMGLGKTEAALYAAYKMLELGQATGIYFALPTQLTSEKIHERMQEFLKSILKLGSLHRKALLVHGQAWLKQFQMGEDASPGGAWFSQGKKGILAPFAVGTLDQALMAVMNVKHGFVRTFGLAGKVVILDEVHSYDAFTGTIMDELVSALRQLDCTVIILSATLTQERRKALIQADVENASYPLITGVQSDGKEVKEIPVELNEIQEVIVHLEKDDSQAFEEALKRADQGQQVLWIENTVAEAQAVYLRLSARSQSLGINVGLLHSRFTQEHRQKNESRWVTLYGKDGWHQRSDMGRILVGTQVLEQSLDIDADFLVSRLAPTDMLLQRLGRLWRHDNPRRNVHAKQEVWVLAPSLMDAVAQPVKILGSSSYIYAPYVLCRTLEVWQSLNHVKLPTDIRTLIESTYAEREETEQMARHLDEVKKVRQKLYNLALMGLSTVGSTKPEERAQTRYSEMDTTEVLLLESIQFNETHKNHLGSWLTLLNQEKLFLPHNGHAFGYKSRQEIAAVLAQNTVKVADYLAPAAIDKKRLSWLKDYFYLGHPEAEKSLIGLALVGEDEQLKALDGGVLVNQKYQLSYSEYQGYQAIKNKQESL